MKLNINKLMTMNYQITVEDDFFYATRGIRSIWTICKRYNLNFKYVLASINNLGYYEQIRSGICLTINMI